MNPAPVGILGTTSPAAAASLRRGARISVGLAVAGAAVCVLGLAADPHRFSFAWLWAFALGWTVVLGSLFMVALHHATRSIWSVVVRRVAEAMSSCAPILVVLALPVLVFAWQPGVFDLFPWLDPARVSADPVLAGKAPYLDVRFLTVRLCAFLLIWWAFARAFVRGSLAQDRADDAVGRALSMRRLAPLFLVIFGFTVTFASFDLLMSLEPRWFSTIFGIYIFAGMFLAALAVVTLLVLFLRSRGLLGDGLVRGEHLYSLGGLLFAMTCFWAYIAFAQFLLIWSGNLPEETSFFVRRTEGGWLAASLVLPLLRFVVPFLVLMSRPAKMQPRLLAAMAVLVLVGQALDLYWIVLPAAGGGAAVPSWIDAGPLLLVAGVLGRVTLGFLQRNPGMAVGDPLLPRSLQFHL